MAIKCIAFDCDGVILDSVGVKTKAFALLVKDYPKEQQNAFVEYHLKNGGVSRYKKFAWFFENFLGRPITDEESKQWGKNFAYICYQELLDCQLIKGAEESLKYFYGKMPLYICSGAPTEEQASILKAHNLAHYFTDILGSPPDKATVLKTIVERESLAPTQVLMVGDAKTDLDAAQTVGTNFFGVGGLKVPDKYISKPDLQELRSYVDNYNQ